jgi:crossover junction endodeoxyribonuclease RusA
MITNLSFFIHGIPGPGGSKTAMPIRRGPRGPLIIKGQQIKGNRVFGHPAIRVIDASTKTGKTWRKAVTTQAKRIMEEFENLPTDQPVILNITFVMPRPKMHFGTGRNAEVLKPGAPEHHKTKPDRTKLLRSTEDALTGILWKDDSQVIAGDIRKVYQKNKNEAIGAQIDMMIK